MKCKNCGTEFDVGVFCPECGTKNDIQKSTKDESLKEVIHQDKLKENTTSNSEQLNTVYHGRDKANQSKNTSATVSLVAGILSVVTLGCWIIPEIVAIVCGISSKKNGETRTAKAGIICGIIGSIMFLLIVIYAISVNISNEPASTGVEKTEAIVTTEEVAEANTTKELTTTDKPVTTEEKKEKEDTKDKSNLSQYYGKTVSELQDSTGMEMEKDGNAYYAGTLFLNTNNNDKIISMSMTFNSAVGEGVLNFEGITASDTINDTTSKLESAGYKLEKDLIYKNKNMMVILSEISEEEFYLQYISEEEYTNQQNKPNDNTITDEYHIGDTGYGNSISVKVIDAEVYEYTLNELEVKCEITNTSDETIRFGAEDYFSISINNIKMDDCFSDYDMTEIPAGSTFQATISCFIPNDYDKNSSSIIMTADGIEFNLAK